MLQKSTSLFLIFCAIGLFLPFVGFGAGIYYACDWEKPYSSGGKCWASLDRKTGEGKGISGDPKPVCFEGLVPCGKEVMYNGKLEGGRCVKTGPNPNNPNVQKSQIVFLHCQLCHFFVMIDKAINFFLLDIIPPLVIFMLVLSGVMYYFGGAKPELLGKSKTLIKGVVIGLFLIYGAYIIVGAVLTVLGAAEVNPIKDVFNKDSGIFYIKCPIEGPIIKK